MILKLSKQAFLAALLYAGQGAIRPCPAAQNTGVVSLPAPPAAASAGEAPAYRVASGASTGANGLMWQAASPTNTVYLTGSIHFGSRDMYPLPPHIEAAFEKSAILAVEIDLNKVNPTDAMGFVAANGMYPQDDTLWNHVSTRTRERLSEFCSARGLIPGMFARMKPWAASLMLSTLLMQASGFQADLGIDMHFLKQARGEKRVEQLESMDQQLRMFAQGSAEEQERALERAAEDLDKFNTLAGELKDAWLRGDAARIDALMSSALEGSPLSRKRLLADRNPQMAAAVERYLQAKEPCFVVVGAGHLVGTDSVIALLRKKGFKVTQVLAPK